MGFTVSVEADYRAGVLATSGGGNAVLAFLSGLSYFCSLNEAKDNKSPSLEMWRIWYTELESLAKQPLCQICSPLIQAMWSDGGDSVVYTENEYEWFCKRNGSELTEEQFKSFVSDAETHWVDIQAAMSGVKYLIDLFKTFDLQPLDGCYDLKNTIPDFESLYETLEIFAKQQYGVIRLNFS